MGAELRPTAKALASPPDPTVGAPALDPTWERLGVRFPRATRHLRTIRAAILSVRTCGYSRRKSKRAKVRSRMSAPGGIAPWKAHEVRWSGMAATVKLSQQPRTESCVVPGNGHCEA
jgi:hypothetical protein